MSRRPLTHCLTHQLPEDQATPLGLVCRECCARLNESPPEGERRGFWESQPGAYATDGRPCWVFSLLWDDFRIRSLHPAEAAAPARSRVVQPSAAVL